MLPAYCVQVKSKIFDSLDRLNGLVEVRKVSACVTGLEVYPTEVFTFCEECWTSSAYKPNALKDNYMSIALLGRLIEVHRNGGWRLILKPWLGFPGGIFIQSRLVKDLLNVEQVVRFYRIWMYAAHTMLCTSLWVFLQALRGLLFTIINHHTRSVSYPYQRSPGLVNLIHVLNQPCS